MCASVGADRSPEPLQVQQVAVVVVHSSRVCQRPGSAVRSVQAWSGGNANRHRVDVFIGL
jgi:hypothetical protein